MALPHSEEDNKIIANELKNMHCDKAWIGAKKSNAEWKDNKNELVS